MHLFLLSIFESKDGQGDDRVRVSRPPGDPYYLPATMPPIVVVHLLTLLGMAIPLRASFTASRASGVGFVSRMPLAFGSHIPSYEPLQGQKAYRTLHLCSTQKKNQ